MATLNRKNFASLADYQKAVRDQRIQQVLSKPGVSADKESRLQTVYQKDTGTKGLVPRLPQGNTKPAPMPTVPSSLNNGKPALMPTVQPKPGTQAPTPTLGGRPAAPGTDKFSYRPQGQGSPDGKAQTMNQNGTDIGAPEGRQGPVRNWSQSDYYKLIQEEAKRKGMDPARYADFIAKSPEQRAKLEAMLDQKYPPSKMGEAPPNGVSNDDLDAILNGTRTASFEDVPVRDEPTGATADNPVVDMSPSASSSGELSGTDQEKYTSIAIKLSNGESLTDEETQFLISQQFASSNTAPDVSGVQAEITKQLGETQAQFEARAAEQKTARETLLAEQKALSDKQLEEKNAGLDSAAQKEQAAAQSSLSFTGFGRSTVANDAMQEIQVKYNDQKQYYKDAADLQLELAQKELQSADDAELQPYKDRIAELQTESRKVAIDNAVAVAEMNSQQGVRGLEALSNILQILPESSQSKVNSEISKLLGYVADDYGNPVFTDASGNAIPVQDEASKYTAYTDPYSGQIYFYDPADPLGTWTGAPGNSMQTFSDSYGNPLSSPTTSTGGIQDVTDQLNEEFQQYGANCYTFAKQFVPNIPAGGMNVNERIAGIKTAEEGGYGGSDMNFAKAGDAIHTSEGPVGHTAIIAQIYLNPDDNKKYGVLLEANYKSGKVTYGRTIALDDPKVLGYIRGNGTQSVSNAFDGQSYAIEDVVNGNVGFSPAQEAEFKAFASIGKVPEFTGKTQQQKDQQLVDFKKNYDTWAGMPNNQSFLNQAKMTETQKTAFNYAEVMQNAENNYSAIQSEILKIPTSTFYLYNSSLYPNAWKPPAYQQFEQAIGEFINAKLRRESGAAISASEYSEAQRVYFPVPGDSEAVIEQKNKARENVLEQLYGTAGVTQDVTQTSIGSQTDDEWAAQIAQDMGGDITKESVMADMEKIKELVKSKGYSSFDLSGALSKGYSLQEIYDYIKTL